MFAFLQRLIATSLSGEALVRVTRRRDSALASREGGSFHFFTFLAKMDDFRFEVQLQEPNVLISWDATKVLWNNILQNYLLTYEWKP
jgi:hypothetical protein